MFHTGTENEYSLFQCVIYMWNHTTGNNRAEWMTAYHTG